MEVFLIGISQNIINVSLNLYNYLILTQELSSLPQEFPHARVTYCAYEYVLTHISASFPQNIKFFHERLLHIIRHLPLTVWGPRWHSG